MPFGFMKLDPLERDVDQPWFNIRSLSTLQTVKSQHVMCASSGILVI